MLLTIGSDVYLDMMYPPAVNWRSDMSTRTDRLAMLVRIRI